MKSCDLVHRFLFANPQNSCLIGIGLLASTRESFPVFTESASPAPSRWYGVNDDRGRIESYNIVRPSLIKGNTIAQGGERSIITESLNNFSVRGSLTFGPTGGGKYLLPFSDFLRARHSLNQLSRSGAQLHRDEYAAFIQYSKIPTPPDFNLVCA